MIKFNFANAFLHFRRTDAPAGFTWKYLLSYVIGVFLFTLLAGLLVGGVSNRALMAFGAATTYQQSALEMIGIYSLLMPMTGLFAAIFEASYLRRYMRKGGFKLRLGKDELRLLVVYFIWFLFASALYIGIIGLMIVGVEAGDFFAGLIVLLGLAVWVFLAVRFSAAAALTIRDQKIRFASSWRVTKGRFWVLFGAHLVWFGIVFVLYIVISSFAVAYYMNYAGSFDYASGSGGMIVGFGLVTYFLAMITMGYFYNIWAGPAALAARTDPDYAGYDDPAEVFT